MTASETATVAVILAVLSVITASLPIVAWVADSIRAARFDRRHKRMEDER